MDLATSDASEPTAPVSDITSLLPSIGAVLGEYIAAWALSSLQMDVQIIGAFLGALVTVLLVRLTSPIRRLSPPLPPEESKLAALRSRRRVLERAKDELRKQFGRA